MTRCIIRLKNDDCLNLPADYIDLRDGWIMAWRGETIVAIAKADEVIACWLSEKKE